MGCRGLKRHEASAENKSAPSEEMGWTTPIERVVETHHILGNPQEKRVSDLRWLRQCLGNEVQDTKAIYVFLGVALKQNRPSYRGPVILPLLGRPSGDAIEGSL